MNMFEDKLERQSAIRHEIEHFQERHRTASMLQHEAERREGTDQAFSEEQVSQIIADYSAASEELRRMTLLVENPPRLITLLRFIAVPEEQSRGDGAVFFNTAIEAARLAVHELGDGGVGTSAYSIDDGGMIIKLPSKPPEMLPSEAVRRANYVGDSIMLTINNHPDLVGHVALMEVLPEITLRGAHISRSPVLPSVKYPMLPGQILVGIERTDAEL